MKYILIRDNIVHEIILEENPIFPQVPIMERYSKEFLDQCIIVEEDVYVEPGMLYEDGVFKEAPIPEPIDPEDPTPHPPSEIDMLKIQNQTLVDRTDFLEDALTEVIINVLP